MLKKEASSGDLVQRVAARRISRRHGELRIGVPLPVVVERLRQRPAPCSGNFRKRPILDVLLHARDETVADQINRDAGRLSRNPRGRHLAK